jgi:hypothetical protein
MSPDQLRARFARNDGLPFADVLTEARIRDVVDEPGVRCRDTVAVIIAHRAASGLLAQHGQRLQGPRPPRHAGSDSCPLARDQLRPLRDLSRDSECMKD